MKTGNVNIAEIGYPKVREAFNETLNLCVEKLNKTELVLAQEILEAELFEEASPGFDEMLADTALFSRKERPNGRRAIDRIAPKLPVKRDPLKSEIAAKLPSAFFSIFRIEQPHAEGGVLARDLLDDGRSIHIMDQALAASAAEASDVRFAGRILDLGPWHIGFGIVQRLRKSEALAIWLAVSHQEDLQARRDDLHELIYPAYLYGDNLVMTALEPLIMSLALAIDMEDAEADDIFAHLTALLTETTPSS